MNGLRHIRYRHWLLAIMLLALPISCLDAASTIKIVLQHTPTVGLLIILVWTGCRHPLSNGSYTLLFIYLLMHLLGARYLYSYVPYDDWSEGLLGIRITDAFDFQRNHYDRLVHCCFGLLLFHPVREVVVRLMKIAGGWSYVVAVLTIISLSAVYEQLEGLVTLLFAPDLADSYNGQQGDIWDAQKDSALAMGGALLGALLEALLGALRRRRDSQDASAATG